MGTSANERIALQIDSRADPSGVREMRSEVVSLGGAAQKATDEAAASQSKYNLTMEQSRRAMQEAGGNVDKLKSAISRIITEENALATAAARATAELQRQAAAASGGPSRPFGPFPAGPQQLGPFPAGPYANRSVGLAELAAYRMEAERSVVTLEKMVAEENALAAAALKATTELQKQAGVAGQRQLGPFPAGPQQLGPALPNTPGGGSNYANRFVALAELSAYRMEAERTRLTVDKVPGSARTAANALGMLSQAAMTGQGSVAGMAAAAGGLATGISMVAGSAKVAASAAGIGAVITIAVVAAQVLSKLTAAAKNTQVTMDHIGAFSTRQLAGARDELAGIDAQLGAAQKKAADASKYDITNFGGTGVDILSRGAKAAQQELQNLLDRKEALSKKIRELDKTDTGESRERTLAGLAIVAAAQTTSVGRYRGQLAVIEAERVEAIRSRALTEQAANLRAATQRRELATDAETYINGLAEAAATSRDAMVVTSFQARINAANRAAEEEKKALTDRALSTDNEKAALDYIELKRRGIVAMVERERDASLAAAAAQRAAGSDDPRVAMQGKLALIDEEYKANVKLLGVTEALLIAEEKRRKLARDAIQQGLAGYGSLSAAVKNHGTVVGAMAKAAADAVRLYEIGVKGNSARISGMMEVAASQASFASGNIAGGLLHAAAAGGYFAAAIAAGVEAAGVVSGGGGSGAGGGGGSSGFGETGSFQPREGSGGGSMTFVFQQVGAFSREVIDETIFQIDRAKVLKRPIPIAPSPGQWRMGAA